jgi:hypothetical protein
MKCHAFCVRKNTRHLALPLMRGVGRQGTVWPGNAMCAAIHRSPSHMEPRLLFNP